MLINTYLDTEDFVHLYYAEDEPPAPPAQRCGAGARLATKYPPSPRPRTPDYAQLPAPSASDTMTERERYRAPPPSEPPPHRVRAADLYPRLRTHYDEPGIEIGFTPICGEFVQWVGRTADGGSVAMSNYRLHAQPRRSTGPGASVPLRLIDAADISDLTHLVVLCKHGRQLKCTFSTGEQCAEWWRRLNSALSPIGSIEETFAAAYAAWAKEQPPASVHRALLRASHAPQRHWFGGEVERLGFTTKGAWRVTAVNADYKLCSSYPPLLVVPASIGDEDLECVARFRALRRVPAVVWRHSGNGAVLARCSQPEVGWLGWRSGEDERLLAAFVSACGADRGLLPPAPHGKQAKLLIVDARSYASAVTNRARGGGCECPQYYPGADIQFLSLPNIHHVRRSFQQLRALCAEPADQPNWHSQLERTLWPQCVAGVLRAAGVAARGALAGRPVLVHCSDGWDRTPQIVATAQLLLDPHYRTLEGFRVLIEREWLDFGHKFADRCGHQFGPEEPNERSPIFLQWLDVVHQCMKQYPCSFEFNEAYLIKLAIHVHSCMFGTFLCNTPRERAERGADAAARVWHLLRAPAYRNRLYAPPRAHDEQVLWPECGVRYTRVWWALFGARGEQRAEPRAEHAPRGATPGVMTKTRSCENLSSEGARSAARRRRSDPSIAPDAMKLSAVLSHGECRGGASAALTDSCVDALPALRGGQHCHEQVEGLHLDHFESSPRPERDLASGSSSLERELGPARATERAQGPAHTDQVFDHTDEVTDHTDGVVDLHMDLGGSADVPDGTRLARTGGGESGTELAESVVRVSPDTEEPPEFVCDAYNDVIGMAEAAREAGRSRHISITWRSISESSNQSSTGFDLPPVPPSPKTPPSPGGLADGEGDRDNHNCTQGDEANHNVTQPTNHNRVSNGVNGVNGLDEVAANHFLEVDLNGGGISSSVSSESEGEALAGPAAPAASRRPAGRRAASQLTLCPASPRRAAAKCCQCARRASTTSGIETSGESACSGEACWCGACAHPARARRPRCACAGAGGAAHAQLDGLPPAADRLQDRLHEIILYQKKVVEDLSGQLREAREALRRATPPPAARALEPAAQTRGSSASSAGGAASSASSSASGSASEVEVGEEARGVVWLPDSAAPRCQHCRGHFWLARRRHHCRRCGGIFCGSCSEMSSWGDCAVRMCRRCRALR